MGNTNTTFYKPAQQGTKPLKRKAEDTFEQVPRKLLKTHSNSSMSISRSSRMRSGSIGTDSRTKSLCVGIVGGGPAGLCLALVLSKLKIGSHDFGVPINVVLYEKRAERTRLQTLFLDFDNILQGDSGIGGGLAVLFKDLWPILQTKNTCVVSAPFFGDPTCFKVKDLSVFSATNPETSQFDNIPNHLGGLSIPIQSLETSLEEMVSKRPNIRIVRQEIHDIQDLVAKHAILFGCEGRKSVVAQAIESDKLKLPGIRKSHELHAMLVRWKAKKPHVRDQPYSTPNPAQHQHRVFYSPDGNLTFIVQFRLETPKEAEMVYSSLSANLKSIVDTAFHKFEPTLGHIPVDATVLLINIEPYYRSKAAGIVQTKHGTSLLALLGDSLMGVAFLSGWGLNSAFRQINTFEDAFRGTLSHATLDRNSILETLWLQQLGARYARDVYFGSSLCIKESIIRTLAVVPQTSFKGTADDLLNTSWNERSALLVNRLKFNAFVRIARSKTSAFEQHCDYLEKVMLEAKANHNENDLWAWYHNNPLLSTMHAYTFLNKHILVVYLAQGFKDVYKPTNQKQPLEPEMTLFQLYSQDQLHNGYLVRPNLRKLPDDYSFNKLVQKYSHLRTKVLAQKITSIVARAMMACIMLLDQAWHTIRKVETSNTDLVVFLFKKSDFQQVDLPNIPIVRSLYWTRDVPGNTHDDYEVAVSEMMQKVKHHLTTMPNDFRALVVVDKKFGRHIKYLLSVVQRSYSHHVEDVYVSTVGKSGLYR